MEKNLSSFTVKELREQSRKLGLNISGKNKAALIQQIKDTSQEVFLTGVADLDREILLDLSAEDFVTACKTNKYSIKLCTDKKFMLARLQRKYDGNAMLAMIDAAEYGDVSFAKYLEQHHTIDFSYNEYDAFWQAYNDNNINLGKYLVEYSNISEDDLHTILRLTFENSEDVLATLKYIIEETDAVGVIMRKYKNVKMSEIYDELINFASLEPLVYEEELEYLNMMKYLYEHLKQSTYLNVLTDLSEYRYK